MTEHYEARHRALRDLVSDDEETNNINPALWEFEARTGPLMDDLVTAVRRWDDHLPGCQMWRHEVERLGQLLICSGKDTLVVDEDCTCGYDGFCAKLAALDEASGTPPETRT